MSLLTSLRRQSTKKPAPIFNSASSIDMDRLAVIILGGGQGTRLFPLTLTRCKPAVCFGGIYRLIDIPMSNAINSGCHKIFIVTQFLSSSLHQHIFRTYRLGTFSRGFIELLPAEQKPDNSSWFQGTADAVRQNLNYLMDTSVDYFLILSGDQLYNMNFQPMIQFARESDADLIVASLPVNQEEAKRMGILRLNEDRFVTEFYEKPQEQDLLEHLKLPECTMSKLCNHVDKQKSHLGSMGIYLFKRKALINLLRNDSRADFGKHLIPNQVELGNVAAYVYDGYWEDVGTIDSFFKANIALTQSNPAFNCVDEHNPIYAQPFHLPPPKTINTLLQNSILCAGCHIEADLISNSIVGPRTIVKQGTIIKNSYLIGNDFYNQPIPQERLPDNLQIGENCLISNAIIDKQTHLGKNIQLVNKNHLSHYDGDHIYIRDGIIIVASGAYLPDGFIL